jgi:hypothetical protein
MKKILMVGIGLGIIIVGSLFAGLHYFLHNRTKQEISKRVEENSYVEHLEYENLKVGFRGTRFYLRNVSINIKGLKEIIRAEEVIVFNVKTNNQHLLGVNVEIKGVNVSLQNFLSDKSYETLNMINPDGLFSNVGWVYKYDPDHREMTMENIKIIAPELAKIEASIKLLNIDPSAISFDNMMSLLPHVFVISISQASVVYNDYSLLRRIKSLQNDSEDSALSTTLELFSRNINQMFYKEKDEKTREILGKIKNFLNNPERINITLSPEISVPFGRLLWVRHPKEVFELLDVKIQT